GGGGRGSAGARGPRAGGGGELPPPRRPGGGGGAVGRRRPPHTPPANPPKPAITGRRRVVVSRPRVIVLRVDRYRGAYGRGPSDRCRQNDSCHCTHRILPTCFACKIAQTPALCLSPP